MHPSISVEGRATCPPPADVQRRLADLMANIPDDVPQDRAVIERMPDGLHIDLRRDDGSRIAERVLTSAGSCSDLASASAVIVATWEAQLRGERLARIELDRASARGGVLTTAPAPQTGRGSTFEAGLGAVGSLAFGDAVEPALGGLVFGTWSPKPTGLGVSLIASAATARSSTLPTSGTEMVTASWTRAFAALGPFYRFLAGPARLEANAGVVGGALFVSAAGVPNTRSNQSADVGATLGVRLSTRWAPMAPWLGVQGLFWPSRDRFGVTDEGMERLREVPRLEAWLAVGVSFGPAS
jgi:hypothetical protein